LTLFRQSESNCALPTPQDTVSELENLADRLQQQRMSAQIKTATIKGAPRQAILKPAHAQYRLPGQTFALGDRVIMVQESGTNGVPFSMKGVVIGVNTTTVDVVWDTPFLGGNNMGGRCSEYRGSSCSFSACLNLTTPQFSVADKHKPPPSVPASARPAPGFPGQQARPNSNFLKAAPVRPNPQAGFAIASNPSRQGQSAANGASFNNVVQGVRPAQVPAAVAHRANLQHALRGGAAGGGPARPPQPFRPPPAIATRPPPTGPQGAAPASRGGLAQPRGPAIPSQQVPTPQVASGRPPRGPRGGRGKGKAAGGASAPAPAPAPAA
jgi:5'-3' exoribonuclease 1